MALSERWVVASALLLACTELASGSDVEALDEPDAPAVVEGSRAGVGERANVDAATPPVVERWACLERAEPRRAVPRRARVSLTLDVTDIASRQPPEGLRARACSRLDVRCEAPLAIATNEEGVGLRLLLAQGFDGFIEITSEASVPALYFVSQPLEADAHEALFVVSAGGLGALGEAAGVTLETERGHLLSRAFDCDGALADGVRIEAAPLGVPFSLEGGLPRFGSDVTSPDGLVGYVNVPPGLLFIVGRELSSGRECGATSVLARSGWLTYGDIEPTRR